MVSNSGNYKQTPPNNYDGDIEEWLSLSYSTQYYHYNKENQKRYNRELTDRRSEWLQNIKDNESCKNCGESHNRALDFHHTKDKSMGVGQLAHSTYSKERILKEISKCIIICANCHRKHHAGDLDISNLPKGLSCNNSNYL